MSNQSDYIMEELERRLTSKYGSRIKFREGFYIIDGFRLFYQINHRSAKTCIRVGGDEGYWGDIATMPYDNVLNKIDEGLEREKKAFSETGKG